ncbi:MAG TPA: YgeY family selenium metabolism-linked hydrolase [Anaerolineales bacterium]|nr:YgeY family selenium metabolism-linked hydrolase [Anaerolineales bacterium]
MAEITPNKLIDLTQKLVQLSSEPGQERQVSELLLREMPELGFDHIWTDQNGTAVGIIEGNQPGPTLLLDGHIDTVGIAPGLPWEHPPFAGKIEGGRLYGRGATDMKGPLAAMILAAASVDRSLIRGKIVVSASVMEEVLEGAALQAVIESTKPDLVVIGEPSNLRLVHGGRGRAEIRLEAIGRPSHSSAPQLGINAVQAILPAIQKIDALELATHPIVGHAIIALTDIISEPYPGHSVIPSRCRATYDRRLIPGESRQAVLEPLKDLPTLQGAVVEATIAIGEYRAFTGNVLKREKWFPAWLLEQTHPFVQAAAQGLQQAGLSVIYGTYNFCTNAAYSIGLAGIPTIGFGPSPEGLAHIVDEYIEIDQLVKAAHGYKGIIEAVLASE